MKPRRSGSRPQRRLAIIFWSQFSFATVVALSRDGIVSGTAELLIKESPLESLVHRLIPLFQRRAPPRKEDREITSPSPPPTRTTLFVITQQPLTRVLEKDDRVTFVDASLDFAPGILSEDWPPALYYTMLERDRSCWWARHVSGSCCVNRKRSDGSDELHPLPYDHLMRYPNSTLLHVSYLPHFLNNVYIYQSNHR